jgi:hypothetical protein
MANKKFSQFDVRTDSAQIDALVGYQGLANVQISPADLIPTPIAPKFTVTGIFQNLFTDTGSSVGIFGDTLEFSARAIPSADHSSVFAVPFDCKIIGASMKWISDDTPTINGSDNWQVKLYKMNNNAGNSTVASNYNLVGDFSGLLLTSADSGLYPYKTSSTEFTLSAGDIINISGVETGNIASSDGEMEMVIAFEVTA